MGAWVVLYTKNLTQKHKKWLDGFLVINDATRSAVLHDDEGQNIGCARLKLSNSILAATRRARHDDCYHC